LREQLLEQPTGEEFFLDCSRGEERDLEVDDYHWSLENPYCADDAFGPWSPEMPEDEDTRIRTEPDEQDDDDLP
jgi:hypothetical protein